ncbi:MAG: LysR substrate-binding domain-containing protein [Trebonia sp.]
MLDPVLLRSFLAVAQTLSFTQAGERLHLSQPTVSQHVRKLEESVGRQLFERDTRAVTLTNDGEAMAGFARTILAAGEQATSYFTGSAVRGRLRFGASDDLAVTQLPQILREFRQLHPRVDLELTVGQSGVLHRRLNSGHLDLVFVKNEPGDSRGQLLRRDRLVWVGLPRTVVEPDRPVPVVAYQAPSYSRTATLRALERAGRTWRITCNTRELNGVIAATRAGLGIAVFPHSLVPSELVQLAASQGLPELGDIDIVLVTNPRAPREPVDALTTAILNNAGRTLPPASRALRTTKASAGRLAP